MSISTKPVTGDGRSFAWTVFMARVPAVRELMSVLRCAAPWRACAVGRILQRLCLLQQESVLLVMPAEQLVR